MSHNITISQEIIDILCQCTTDANNLYLPTYQLDRQLYVSVNKILEILGGTWKRKAKAHVFDHDPSGDLAAAIESGKVEDWKKKYQFYETPEDLAERMVRLAELEEGQAILEPSAGKGAIAEVIRDRMPPCCKLDVVEIYEPHTQWLAERGFSLASTDFLELRYVEYDCIIMNPPFTGLQDVDHILHAYECLAPGGRIVGIMGESAFFVNYKKAVEFRKWFDEVGGWSEQLPQDTFKESGAGGRSRLVIIDKN
jgi:hypothetical protein